MKFRFDLGDQREVVFSQLSLVIDKLVRLMINFPECRVRDPSANIENIGRSYVEYGTISLNS